MKSFKEMERRFGRGAGWRLSTPPPDAACRDRASLAHRFAPDGIMALNGIAGDTLTVETIAFNPARGESGNAEAMERRCREGQKVIGGWIKASLTLLAEHWSVGRR